jgi:2-polyprenyl-3-methyl-5-hydroxy-6-metoxy-1,4-benzoquinol methylase
MTMRCAYTAESSAQLANARISQSIAESYDFSGKRILDLGCGDGTYTLEFLLGAMRFLYRSCRGCNRGR